MVKIKRVCKVHKVVRNKKLIPCETVMIKKDNQYFEYCPKCKKEGVFYGIKTAVFVEYLK